MTRTDNTKSALFSGTLILTGAGIISRFIGFYYKIFLSRTIGAEGLGMYQLIFPIFALFLAVCSAGIQTAISRFCASCESDRQAKGYLAAGISMSLALSFFCIFLVRTRADWFCRIMMDGMDGASLLSIMTWAIPFAAIHSCINGYYYGQKKTVIPAVSQLLEQSIRVTGVWLLMQIAAEQGRIPAVSDAVWGILIGDAGAVLYCLAASSLTTKKRPRVPHRHTLPLLQTYKNLCSLAIPLTANRLIGSIFSSAEALLIPYSLRSFGYTGSDALSVYGILTGMVFSTIMFPAVISNSLSVMLLPTVSESFHQGKTALVRKAVQRTVQICTILGFTCTFGFLLTGEWIGVHLFHNTLAGVYLKTLCWICPFVFLGSTLGSILHGLGRATATLMINLAASLFRILFICIGIPVIGLKAYLWGMLVSQIFIAVISGLCIMQTRSKKRDG
ncbi:MAG: polysaccharide biosynthesis protein [Lachnospiraceae bacterium]|nr:polysaccharide biosynthesis protein [Lachnospiraceae bacterium]